MNIPALGVSAALLRLSLYRRWLLISAILGGLITGIISAKALPVFTAYARLLPPQTNTATATTLLNQIGGTAALGASALTIKNPSDLYASLFFSRSVQDEVISKYNLRNHYAINDIDDLRANIGSRTKVEVGKDGIITLAYTDKNPQRSADIANGMIKAMYEIARRLAKSEAENRINYYDNLTAEARQRLLKANQQLLEAEKATGLTRFQGQEEYSINALIELRGLIASRQVELQKLSVSATRYHPEVMRLNTELSELNNQLKKLEMPNKLYSQQKTPLLSFQTYAEKRSQVDLLRKEVEIAGSVLEQILKAQALSRVDESRDFSVVSVLDAAVPPTKKSGPRVFVNALFGMILSLLASVILLLAWDVLFSEQERRERWKEVIRYAFRWKK